MVRHLAFEGGKSINDTGLNLEKSEVPLWDINFSRGTDLLFQVLHLIVAKP